MTQTQPATHERADAELSTAAVAATGLYSRAAGTGTDAARSRVAAGRVAASAALASGMIRKNAVSADAERAARAYLVEQAARIGRGELMTPADIAAAAVEMRRILQGGALERVTPTRRTSRRGTRARPRSRGRSLS